MKKQLSIIAALMLLEIFSPQAWAYDGSVVAPSGQTIYYRVGYNYDHIVGYNYDHIIVTYPGNHGWGGYTMPTGSLVIPDSITHGGVKYLVTAIDHGAFDGCSGLTSVTIPNSVTAIGNHAFYNCNGLTSITIPNSVTYIGYHAFYNCSGLTSVNFNADSCTFGGREDNTMFQGCTNLVTLNIGNNVKVIPRLAFYNCSGLTSVTIPNSVTSIGDRAFYGCRGLTSITIPNSVTSIESQAFSDCSGLTSVNFNAESCTFQNRYVFQGCTNLVTLNIGDNVITIPSYAFYGCSHLSEIHSLSRVAPPLGSSAFDGVPSTIPVHIPCGSSASYYSRWSYFSNFIEEAGFTFTATSDNEQQGTVQILTMPTCTSPQAVLYATANSGYRFDHWSDGSTSNPYSLSVTDDLDLIGYFVADGTEGISDIDADGLRIHSENGRIAIEGAEGEAVAIYDMMGRLISGMWIVKGGKQELAVPAGVYLVRIGDKTERKVVVL